MSKLPVHFFLALFTLCSAAAGCDRAGNGAADERSGSARADTAAIIEMSTTEAAAVRRAAAGERMAPGRALLMDMRIDAKAPTPDPDGQTHNAVSAAIGSEATIVGSLEGAFTQPRADQQVYLADDSAGTRWIVVLGRDASLRMRGDDVRYLLSSPDTDRDGINEVLLRLDREAEDGVRTDLRLVSFADGRAQLVAAFPDARVDACATASPTLRAQRIEYAPPRERWPVFVVVASESDCVDGRAPDLNGYIRAQRFDD